eukprot:CAMPEP_0197655992 /NCGR_PEP_ID=MMETSP1338-20131121/39801_1 /TAXON_ID=43686 ORGANISM="Pelagodinium beii, Strain RCC1491" /NCGR_SAMPLE_ID=MMETSP1338 /ASSEMBLY_ACC=CAM_ASM_000754 /LENGTH=297 /DNA_ID=CAMNT_0043231767 /DNA_START=62 /DNA_END=955 /DNA_ORIENTATION=-
MAAVESLDVQLAKCNLNEELPDFDASDDEKKSTVAESEKEEQMEHALSAAVDESQKAKITQDEIGTDEEKSSREIAEQEGKPTGVQSEAVDQPKKALIGPEESDPVAEVRARAAQNESTKKKGDHSAASQGTAMSGVGESTRLAIIKGRLATAMPWTPPLEVKKKIEQWIQQSILRAALFANGEQFKITCLAMEAEKVLAAMQNVEEVVHAHLLSGSELEQQRNRDQSIGQKRAAAETEVGQCDKSLSLSAQLLAFHGGGGKPSKKRRMAERLTQVVSVAQRVAAHNLRAAESDSED